MKKLLILLVLQLFLIGCEDSAPHIKLVEKGKSYIYESKDEKALQYFNESIAKNSKYPDAYIYRAYAYIGLKKYDKAKKDLKWVLSKKYNKTATDSANYLMFILHQTQKKYDKAYVYLTKLLDSDEQFIKESKSNSPAIVNSYLEFYGVLLLKKNRFKESRDVFLKRSKYFPDNFQNYFMLAYIEEEHLGNEQKAIEYLRKVKGLKKNKEFEEFKSEVLRKMRTINN
jgi:tetratricopeptide (TPR) repeat protein